MTDVLAVDASWLVFGGLLTIAACTDLQSRRIPNWTVAALLVCGCVQAVASRGAPGGIGFAMKGAAAGFAIWLPLHALGALGAGDVKLAAGASSWLGAAGAVKSAVVAAIIGGLIALIVVTKSKAWRQTSANLGNMLVSLRAGSVVRAPATPLVATSLPYGVAIAAGALIVALA